MELDAGMSIVRPLFDDVEPNAAGAAKDEYNSVPPQLTFSFST